MITIKSLNINPLSEIKELINTLLKNSKLFLKKTDLKLINSQIDNTELINSFIPTKKIERFEPFYIDDINKKLEGGYIDHLIQLQKIKNLENIIWDLDQMYENTITTNMKKILEYESIIETYKNIQKDKGIYNNSIHETFNYDNNYEGSDRKLSINKETGTIRLNSSSVLLSTREKSDISYEILTSGIEILEENPLDNIYSRDKYKPWYISIISKGILTNKNYANIQLADYEGVVFLVRMQMPSLQQFNRITYSSFSTDTLDLLGIFFSDLYDQNLNSTSLKSIPIDYYTDKNDISKELNLDYYINDESDIINATEIILVFGQKDYIIVENNIVYKESLNLTNIEHKLKLMESERKTEMNGMMSLKNKDVLFDLNKLTYSKKLDLKQGDRNYIIGFTLFSVENIEYEPYGNFRSKNYNTDGNIIAFSLYVNKKQNYSIREYVELFFINFNGNRFSIGNFDNTGKVKDSCLLGNLDIINNLYLGYTNFIPKTKNRTDGKLVFESAIVYLDGVVIDESVYYITTKTKEGYKLIVQSGAAHENSILNMAYTPATRDHNNTEYDPSKIDILKEIGKPNIDINFITYNLADYVYVKDITNTGISFTEGLELFIIEKYEEEFIVIPKNKSKNKIFGILVTQTITGLEPGQVLKQRNTNEWFLKDDDNITEDSLTKYAIVNHVIDINNFTIIDIYTPEDVLFNYNDSFYILKNSDQVAEIETENYSVIKNEIPKHNNIYITDCYNQLILQYGTWENVPTDLEFILEATHSDLSTTIHEYFKNLIIVDIDGYSFKLDNSQQYTLDTDTIIADKNKFILNKDYFLNAKKIKVSYTPLFKTNETSFIQSNILLHNNKEIFTETKNKNIFLSFYPYLDSIIIQNGKWLLNNGIFYFYNNYSIFYEPFIIKINNKKCINITEYRKGTNIPESKENITYTVSENRIVFDKDYTGQIVVEYYNLGNIFALDIEMYKGDNSKYYITPEIKDYNILLALKK